MQRSCSADHPKFDMCRANPDYIQLFSEYPTNKLQGTGFSSARALEKPDLKTVELSGLPVSHQRPARTASWTETYIDAYDQSECQRGGAIAQKPPIQME